MDINLCSYRKEERSDRVVQRWLVRYTVLGLLTDTYGTGDGL
jgi:hypothetical protein